MTDLGLSNGYFCIVEQDDTFKFLIDISSVGPTAQPTIMCE